LRRGQIGDCEGTAIGPDDIAYSGTQLTAHTLDLTQNYAELTCVKATPCGLKNS
jgi:hypothetical protein